MCECRARARNVLRVVIWRLPRASADLLRIEEKGIEFGASVKKKLSSIRGLPFHFSFSSGSGRRFVVVSFIP